MEKVKATVKNQISYINSIKGFGIWLVVLGHLLDAGMLLKTFIYGFHMPLFFSVYGMTYKRPSDSGALFHRIIKRFLSYSVTYLIWALIYCQFTLKNFALVLFGTNASLISAESSGVLWFLPCYFIASVVFEIIMFLFSDKKGGWLITGVIFALLAALGYLLSVHTLISYRWPWGADIAFTASLFVWIGYIVKNYLLPKIKDNALIKCIIGVVCFGGCFLSLLVRNTNAGYIRMASADYGNYILFLITAVCGILFSFILINFIDGKSKFASAVLSKLGMYSLVIMVLQRDFTNLYQSHIPASLDNTFIAIIFSVFCTALCFVLSYIISKLLPPFAGKYQMNISNLNFNAHSDASDE